MSDRMKPIPIDVMLRWILDEYQAKGTIFGIAPHLRCNPDTAAPFLDGQVETPIGPAAGPQTQLAQNIITAYLCGARVFEVKTVQVIDGEDLPVDKPCISAIAEGYNVEWSTELRVPEARDEYIKAHFVIRLLAKEFGLGGQNGFVFNMSVGYDYAGVTTPKIDGYLNDMQDCSKVPIWAQCLAAAENELGRLYQVDHAFLDAMEPCISRSVTVSTLHGCPPDEIEKISAHLIEVKGLHTYVKCNPTLLGYESARSLLDSMGFTDVHFGTEHFEHDLHQEDAIPMFRRLKALSESKGLQFGVKLTNTFPVDNDRDALPGQEMYMSGVSLYTLSLTVAKRLSEAFDGTLSISYCGGADALHLTGILDTGIFPVTMSTTLLKPGGYKRLEQMAKRYQPDGFQPTGRVDVAKIQALLDKALSDRTLRRPVKPVEMPKRPDASPLLDCFVAHCTDCCPFNQDIPRYLKQLQNGDYKGALTTILDRNPLPNMTGTICSHHCTAGCARNHYEEAVDIRGAKLVAVKGGWDEIVSRMEPPETMPHLHVAVVGGGPAGMAVSHLLARKGAKVTLFEKERTLGGIVRHVIPSFRISNYAIEQDAKLLELLGVELKLGAPAPKAQELLEQGYTHVVLACGASKASKLSVEGDTPLIAVEFLRRVKALESFATKQVVVVGGGNTAMDAARAAARLGSEPQVTVAYRRSVREMPADPEELELAKEDGVSFKPLRNPVKWENGVLTLEIMQLGEPDASGRRSPIASGVTEEIPCDMLIGAVGDGVDGAFLTENMVAVQPNGKPVLDVKTLESSSRRVYVAGDMKRGGASIAHAIADAHRVADAIVQTTPISRPTLGRRGDALAGKGILQRRLPPEVDGSRCLACNIVCEHCVEVCPNRANVAIPLLSSRQTQIVHIDGMCNECGNCAVFCPYSSAPYQTKFTVFSTVEDFLESKQDGFVLVDAYEKEVKVRLSGSITELSLNEPSELPSGIHELIETICNEYAYLLY